MAKSKPVEKEAPRALPNIQICRAANITKLFGECLVHQPRECPYAMPFGYVFLCGHPDRNAIIANTIASHGTDRGTKGTT